MRKIGGRLDRLQPSHLPGSGVGDQGFELFGRLSDCLDVARHLCGRHQEMQVVRIIAVRVDTGRALRCYADALEIGLVRCHRLAVDFQAVDPPADLVIDVRWHVHDVSGAGHEGGKPVGMGFGPLRRRGRLDGMDIEMDRAGMIRIARQHPLQRGHKLDRVRLWRCSAVKPVVPGHQVHKRVSVEHGDLVILRMAVCQFRHRRGIGLVQGALVGRSIGAVALGERGDKVLFPAGGEVR
ncbi:MAG: hypothetical protein E5Y81_03930 [Mesorhizobium sp.]|nr:MAG: hypothetical protein E5Y81_03930 [Mesorhizobium sp.]